MAKDDARVLMMDLYEREFGIYNHGPQADNPLSSALFHEQEDVWMDSRLRDIVESFAVQDLGKLWNISLPEFLKLPAPYVEMLMKLKESIAKQKAKAIEDAVNGKGQ